jgi:hypothetical protein
MSQYSEYYVKQQEWNGKMKDLHLGLNDDVKLLNDKIVELQNSPGEVTPDDKVLLNDLQEKIGLLADKLKDLDALTPPVAPVE